MRHNLQLLPLGRWFGGGTTLAFRRTVIIITVALWTPLLIIFQMT